MVNSKRTESAREITRQALAMVRGAHALVSAEADEHETGWDLRKCERELARGVSDLEYALDSLTNG